jgi:hypothetical protein
LATAILASEALLAYLIFALRLAEIYVPFVRHTDLRFLQLPDQNYPSSINMGDETVTPAVVPS